MVGRAGLGVGDRHLHDGEAVDDGADAAAVLEPHLVQHEALAVVEADAEVPFLPLDPVALDLWVVWGWVGWRVYTWVRRD